MNANLYKEIEKAIAQLEHLGRHDDLDIIERRRCESQASALRDLLMPENCWPSGSEQYHQMRMNGMSPGGLPVIEQTA